MNVYTIALLKKRKLLPFTVYRLLTTTPSKHIFFYSIAFSEHYYSQNHRTHLINGLIIPHWLISHSSLHLNSTHCLIECCVNQCPAPIIFRLSTLRYWNTEASTHPHVAFTPSGRPNAAIRGTKQHCVQQCCPASLRHSADCTPLLIA